MLIGLDCVMIVCRVRLVYFLWLWLNVSLVFTFVVCCLFGV